MGVPKVGRNYLIVLDGLDEMTVKVELSEAGFDGELEHVVALQKEIASLLRAEILTKPKVDLVAPGTLPISEGKAKRVIDSSFSKSGGRVEFLTREGGGAWWCGARDDTAANAQSAAAGGTPPVGR